MNEQEVREQEVSEQEIKEPEVSEHKIGELDVSEQEVGSLEAPAKLEAPADLEESIIAVLHTCFDPEIPATARASFAFYNTKSEIDSLVAGIHKVKEVFGS